MYMYIHVCISYMSWHTCQYNIVMSVVKRASSSGEREGEERGGPKGGGRERRERDGDSRDGGGQKRYSGNAWSRGRPRISSGDGPPQMKKYEEPQMPVSLNINDLKCSANLLLSLSLSLSSIHTHHRRLASQADLLHFNRILKTSRTMTHYQVKERSKVRRRRLTLR